MHGIGPDSPLLYMMYAGKDGACFAEEQHLAIFNAAVRCVMALTMTGSSCCMSLLCTLLGLTLLSSWHLLPKPACPFRSTYVSPFPITIEDSIFRDNHFGDGPWLEAHPDADLLCVQLFSPPKRIRSSATTAVAAARSSDG